MCAIIGALLNRVLTKADRDEVNTILEHIWDMSHERGRDGRGWKLMMDNHHRDVEHHDVKRDEGQLFGTPVITDYFHYGVLIGNMRAEPTTEFVKEKSWNDQQPYTAGQWSIVHNGTIANDRELRDVGLRTVPTNIDSAAIAELLDRTATAWHPIVEAFRKLKGSYAVLAANRNAPHQLIVAANYRPIWYIHTPHGFFFASARNYLPSRYPARMIEPYTVNEFTMHGIQKTAELRPTSGLNSKALVVCSGGLDSVVSATYAKQALGMDIHLIHFMYGSRAEGPEVEAVKSVANELDCELTLFPLPVYSKGDSPLLDPDSKVAGGEEGAEFAHEWVPARNLMLLATATAFAEARGIETIVLGNNLEEAGAYPDNEPEFIARFNDLLPFAVGDGKRVKVIMPVGNLMKHEIVALGHDYGAPMHATWSCYRAGALHCGTCGPCYMRRKAFAINELPEVIEYEK